MSLRTARGVGEGEVPLRLGLVGWEANFFAMKQSGVKMLDTLSLGPLGGACVC